MRSVISRVLVAIAIYLSALVCVQTPATAYIHGVASVTGPCPYGLGLGDGCDTAPVGAQKSDPTLYTASEYSTNGTYHAHPSHNVAGVDYPVGHLAGAHISSALIGTSIHGCASNMGGTPGSVQCSPLVQNLTGTITGTTFIPGTVAINHGALAVGMTLNFACDQCSHPKIIAASGSNWILDQGLTQFGSPVTVTNRPGIEVAYPIDIEGYEFFDANFYLACDDSSNCANPVLTFKNNIFHIGKALCQYYGGTGAMSIGDADLDGENNTFVYDPECRSEANLYKTTLDPGLQTQSTMTGTITAGVITISANSGYIQPRQYINYAGQTKQLAIVSISSGDHCVDSGCNGLTLTLTDTSINSGGPVTITTGPAQAKVGNYFYGGWNVKLWWNWFEGGGNMLTGGSLVSQDIKYNYSKLYSEGASDLNPDGAHTDGVAQHPSVASAGTYHRKSFDEQYNTIVNGPQAGAGTITGDLAMFSTYNGMVNNGGWFITDYWTVKHNTLIVADTKNYGSALDLAAQPYYSNGGYILRDLGQGFAVQADFTAHVDDNGDGTSTVHVTAMNSGTIHAGDFLECTYAYPTCYLAPLIATSTQAGDVSTWIENISNPHGSQEMQSVTLPGAVLNFDAEDNYFDGGRYFSPFLLGSDGGTYYFGLVKGGTGSFIKSGNTYLTTGGSAD